MKTFDCKPIGYVRSEHRNPEETPIQPVFCPECAGRVEVLPEYAEGLTDIQGFSHIILLYWMHKAPGPEMMTKPFLHGGKHGVFATRSPRRPNPIGLSIVRLVRKEGPVLHVRGIDILDGTPVLDIKPYSSMFDCFSGVRNGWQEDIDKNTANRLGRRGYTGGDAGVNR
jgi:tRNA-Thr(GGU) m(6)t(6)A37 methyltransferase TsaA